MPWMLGLGRGVAMNKLQAVTSFVIPRRILHETEKGLAPFGQALTEGRVLWYGRYDKPDVFRFTTAVVPEQKCTAYETVVDHDEILRQSLFALQRDEELGAQVHTHPGAAFHSSIDNECPIIREIGGLSIVIPDFCEAPLRNLAGCATFRLTESGWCGPLNDRTMASLVRIP
jgi:hypothetical protein